MKHRHEFLILIGSYFVLQVALRVLISPSAGLDEAEQLILSQHARLGYGPQPPLYTWLQMGFFTFLGQNILALAVLKNGLLFATYLFAYLAARQIARDSRVATMAGASLLLLPGIAWEAQRELSHSVLLVVIVAASVWATAKLFRTGQTQWYAIAGACIGFGFLAKYNYVLFLGPFLLAAMTLPHFRRALMDRRSILAVAVAITVLMPHGWWILRNLREATSGSQEFYGTVPEVPRFVTLYILGKFTTAVLAFTFLLLLFYAVCMPRAFAHRLPHDGVTVYETLLLRTMAIGLVIALAIALVFQIYVIKSRWLQPLLFLAPIYLAVRVRHLEGRYARRFFAAVVVLVAITVTVVQPWRLLRPSATSRQPLNWPFQQLAQQLRANGFTGGTIVADTKLIGGNLRLAFPDSTVAVPFLPVFEPDHPGDCLVVWNAADWPAPPRWTTDLARHLCGDVAWPEPRSVEAPLLHGQGTPLRLMYFHLRH